MKPPLSQWMCWCTDAVESSGFRDTAERHRAAVHWGRNTSLCTVLLRPLRDVSFLPRHMFDSFKIKSFVKHPIWPFVHPLRAHSYSHECKTCTHSESRGQLKTQLFDANRGWQFTHSLAQEHSSRHSQNLAHQQLKNHDDTQTLTHKALQSGGGQKCVKWCNRSRSTEEGLLYVSREEWRMGWNEKRDAGVEERRRITCQDVSDSVGHERQIGEWGSDSRQGRR